MNTKKFYKELGQFFGVPADVEITDVDEDVYYSEGCPTCGGDYEFQVHITGIKNNRSWEQSYRGRLLDFIDSLS